MGKESATYDILLGKNTLSKGYQDVDRAAAKAEDAINRINNSGGGNGGGGGGMFKSIVGGNLVANAIQRTVGSFSELGRHILDNTVKYQSFENVVNAASRSEEEGRHNIRFINTEIKELGLNLDAAREGYQTFSGAMMGTSLQGEKGNKIFKQLSEGMTVMHLGAEQQKGAFLALGQMMSKGKVQAEELRGQLGERIPGAFQMAARAMKMSTAELDKFMSQGKLVASDFLPKFAEEIEKTFIDKLPNAMESTQANLERLSTSWENLLTNVGKSKTGVINFVVKGGQNILENINSTLEHENKRDEALEKYGGGYSTWDKFSDFIQFGKNKTSNKSQDTEYMQGLRESYGYAEGDDAKLLKEKYDSLYKIAKSVLQDTEKDWPERQRESSMIRSVMDELHDEMKVKNIKPNKDGKGVGGKSTAGSGVTIEAGTPKNININIANFQPNWKVESVDTSIPISDIKEKTGRAMIELLNDAAMMEGQQHG